MGTRKLLLWSLTVAAVATLSTPFCGPAFSQQTYEQTAVWDFSTGLGYSSWQSNYPAGTAEPVLRLTNAMALLSDRIGYVNDQSVRQRVDFHIAMDNFAQPDYLKRVWIEFDLYVPDAVWPDIIDRSSFPVFTILWNDELSTQTGLVPDFGPVGADGFRTVSSHFEIWPQPDNEDINAVFWVPAGSELYVDNVTMITRCVPIPEPVFFQMGALLGMGGLGMLKLRKR